MRENFVKTILIMLVWLLAIILVIQNISYTKLISKMKNPTNETVIETTNNIQEQQEKIKINENNQTENKKIQEKVNKENKNNSNNNTKKETKRSVAKVIGKISIPDIDLQEKNIYEGTDLEILAIGIGHFTNTSICNGNVGLASHNSGGKGDEFKNLKNIKVGSKILYQTQYGEKTYLVETIKEISDEDWSYLSETKDNRITLLTCISGKPNSRLCVQGKEKT